VAGEDPRERARRVAAFGRWLLQERELRGLSRDDLARLTKLPAQVVESLESGDAGRMPARAYLLGTLRAYAAATGFDPDEAVLRWQEADGEGEAAPAAAPRRRPRRLLVALALVAVAALALGTFFWSRRTRVRALPDRSARPMERAPYVQP
jgi:cytoskeletal protein RodZ